MNEEKRIMLRNAFSAFEQLDLSEVQSINLELVEYDDVTNKLALEVVYSQENKENDKEHHIHTEGNKASELNIAINGKEIAGRILAKSGDARL
ncbi:MAG: hypothetical protein ACLRKY_03455 [Enterococcus gallinarum]|uniref:hypothetical protein n=1 Tax=Enterococcus sp. TaxID=35783 RepID=UPI001B2A2C75|nr:hypothetical protein [Enterococcus faecium]